MEKITTASKLNATLCLLVIVLTGLGCLGIKRPWRDYSPIPFDSKAWLAGDKIERGRMNRDFITSRNKFGGLTTNGVVELLGQPDLKKTIENKEVWFYRVDIGISGGMDLIPISFDEKGRSMFGMVQGSTFSAMAKEDDL